MKAITGDMIMTGASTRVDGSLGLKFSTSELTAPEKVALLELQGKVLEVLLQPKDEQPAGRVDIKGEFDRISPSQRIRNILFCIWKYETEQERTSLSFDDFYLKRTSAIIDDLKKQLPDRPF